MLHDPGHGTHMATRFTSPISQNLSRSTLGSKKRHHSPPTSGREERLFAPREEGRSIMHDTPMENDQSKATISSHHGSLSTGIERSTALSAPPPGRRLFGDDRQLLTGLNTFTPEVTPYRPRGSEAITTLAHHIYSTATEEFSPASSVLLHRSYYPNLLC